MTTEVDSVSARIAALFPAGVAAEEGEPGAVHGILFPEEKASLGRAAAKREDEFRAGRVLVRRALRRLGVDEAPLPVAPDRAPVWPAGVVGSISHTRGFCGVVVARNHEVRALGLDVERAIDLNAGLIPRICTAREREWLAEQPGAERGRLAKLLFSAKECVYKAQYPLTGRFLGFHDVELVIDPAGGEFSARILAGRDEASALARVGGRFLFDGAFVMTGVGVLPAG